MRKTIVPLLLLSALIATPASANYFSNPRANVNLNIGSAPNPKPSDYRTVRIGQAETRTETTTVVPDPPPPAPPPPPRKPYVVGRTYDALPGGCMKLIQDGGSYYLCSGEWYRPLGGGRYLAIAQP